MIVLDTHAWIWWASNPEQLSQPARDAIERAAQEESVCISCISSWEVALLVAKERLRLTLPVSDWIAMSEKLKFIRFIPLDNTIALKSVSLPPPFHTDPADRIIIATALSMGAPVVTRDEKIQSYPHVQSIW